MSMLVRLSSIDCKYRSCSHTFREDRSSEKEEEVEGMVRQRFSTINVKRERIEKRRKKA